MSKFAALILALIAVILVMPVHPVHAENPIEETTDNIIVSINRMFDRPPVVSVSPRVKEYRVGQGEAQSGEELDEYVVVDIYARDDTEVKGVVAGFGASNQALDQLDWSLKNLGILKDQLAEISFSITAVPTGQSSRRWMRSVVILFTSSTGCTNKQFRRGAIPREK